MLSHVLTVAEKELIDGWRDRRALVSAALYCLMGPAVVGAVSLTVGDNPAVLMAMMSVFTLVSAFVGGMNVAMDCVAGERERRSLLPLLLHPVRRIDLLLGKWLAVSAFGLAGLAVNLAGFAVLFRRAPSPLLLLCLAPLALLAAASELWVSTVCRNVKEAHSYLSMLVFLPMMVGMFMVFSPVSGAAWWRFVPIAGHQVALEAAMRTGAADPLRLLFLGFSTAGLTALALVAAADRLEQDDVVYGA